MAYLAGDILTAQRTNRLQPKRDYTKSSGNVAASQSGVDVPGTTLSFTVETSGAELLVWFTVDFDNTASPGANVGSARVSFDAGAAFTDAFAIYGANITDGRATVSGFGQFEGLAVGAHTVRIVVTTPAAMIVNQYSTIMYQLFEVV